MQELPQEFILESSKGHGTRSADGRLIRITASTLYDAGVIHGKFARDEMVGFFSYSGMTDLLAYVKTPTGKAVLEAMQKANTEAFPELVEEMKGIAHGSGLSLNDIWVANLQSELQDAMAPGVTEDHCSDVYTYNLKNKMLVHGHNEDWDKEVKPFWYFVEIIPSSADATFSSCFGMGYPGTLIGYAPTWNRHGIYMTQNTVKPLHTRTDGGVGLTFAQRHAICGGEGAKTADEYISRLESSVANYGWATGASLNVVDIPNNIMANVEIWTDFADAYYVPYPMNYTHFNKYYHLKIGQKEDSAPDNPINTHRIARINEMPAPHTVQDVIDMIGDTKDKDLPVYRAKTLNSFVVDGARSEILVWDGVNPKYADPAFRFPLHYQEPNGATNGVRRPSVLIAFASLFAFFM